MLYGVLASSGSMFQLSQHRCPKRIQLLCSHGMSGQCLQLGWFPSMQLQACMISFLAKFPLEKVPYCGDPIGKVPDMEALFVVISLDFPLVFITSISPRFHCTCRNGAGDTTSSRRTSLELEDDACVALAARVPAKREGHLNSRWFSTSASFSTSKGTVIDKSSLPDESLRHTFFGKPVEGSLAHHTVMGKRMEKFDFLVQPFVLVEAEWDEDARAWSSVTLVQHGVPVTCRLSHLPYDILAKRLHIWTSCRTGYRVLVHMQSG